MSRVKNYLLIILCYLILVVTSVAQNQLANINVRVKNQFDEIIPGANITLTKFNQPKKSLQSNKQGTAQFSKLAEGEYTLEVTAEGFNPYKLDKIILSKNETKTIEIILEVKAIESDVTVGGDDDVENTGTTTVLNENQIAKLPSDPKDLERVLRNMAGESITGEQMPITVDGETGGKIPPKEAIQAVRINQNVLSAQYDNPNGWGIEIYTRSNVDKFSTSVRYTYKDSKFNARDFFIGQKVPMRNMDFFGSLSGPITKTSAFNLWIGHSRNTSSKVINATALDANLQPIMVKESFPSTSNGTYLGFTANADLNKKNKIAISYNGNYSDSVGEGVGDFSLSSRANNSKFRYHGIRFSETYFVSENLINQFRVVGSANISTSAAVNNDVAVNVLEAFSGGGSQNNRAYKSYYLELNDDISWQWKKYSLNVGGRVRGQKINQSSTQNYGGSYTFSGRLALQLDGNNNPVLDTNGAFILTQVNSLEVYRRTLFFRHLGYTPGQIRSLGGGASQFTISGGDPNISLHQMDFAGYLQNSYKLSETLALSFGLRYENQTNISSRFDFSPRLGLIWAPKNDPKGKPIKALPKFSLGYGIFYSRFGLNNFVAIEQATGDRAAYLITESNLLDLFPAVSSVSQLQAFATPRTQRFLSRDLRSPKMHIYSANASKKLPAGFSSNFTVTYSKSVRQNVTRNINSIFNGVRPLGEIGNVYETESLGKAENTRYSVSLNLPQNIMWGNIRYSYTKSKDNRVTGSGLPTNPFDFSQEFAPNSGDGVHSITSYFSYELPYKFSIYGDFSYRSGGRFNITTGRDTNGDGYFNERPSFATDFNKPNLIFTEYGVLDPNPTASDKIIPRNLGRGNSTTSFDLSISKTFGFHEDKANKKPAKQNLTFSVQIQNVFNIFNRGNPIGNMSSPNFLKTLSNSGGNLIDSGEGFFYFGGNTSPRSLSFSMSFSF